MKQIDAKLPAYDLRPLFNLLKKSPAADITEALDINNPELEVTRNTPLRAEFAKFRRAVRVPTKKAAGMQYEHYTTLMQVFDLLFDGHEFKALSNIYTNFDKCDLAWRQIMGPLMDGLPHIGRFGFARAFEDDKRTLSYKYDSDNFFPDASSGAVLTGLGFDFSIFGAALRGPWGVGPSRRLFPTSCRATASNLQNLCSHAELKRPSV